MTPKGWFRSSRFGEEKPINQPSGITRVGTSPRRNKKRLILSQSMVIDIDPNKVTSPTFSIAMLGLMHFIA